MTLDSKRTILRRPGPGPTIVLQHGFLGGAGYWRPLLKHFSDDLNIVMMQSPGFSPGQREVASISEAADELIAVIGKVSSHPVVLVGHSMGGMIAQEVALKAPHIVDMLVLYGTAGSGTLPGRFESIDESMATLTRDGLTAAAERVTSSWFVNGKLAPRHKLCIAVAKHWTIQEAKRALRMLPAWHSLDRLTAIDRPVLVICGDRDRSTPPDQSLQLAQAIKQAELCVMPHCAHAAHLERPDLFASFLTDFLRLNS